MHTDDDNDLIHIYRFTRVSVGFHTDLLVHIEDLSSVRTQVYKLKINDGCLNVSLSCQRDSMHNTTALPLEH